MSLLTLIFVLKGLTLHLFESYYGRRITTNHYKWHWMIIMFGGNVQNATSDYGYT